MGIFSRKKDNDEIFLDELEANEEGFVKFGNISHQEPSHALTPQEVLKSQIPSSHRTDSGNALDSLKKRMLESTEKTYESSKKTEASADETSAVEKMYIKPASDDEKTNQTLLERCKPFITDENGVDTSVNAAPLYKLESVAEILKSDSQKALERLSEKYAVSFDDLGKLDTIKPKKSEVKPIDPKPIINEPQPKYEPDIFEDEIKISSSVKNVQSSVSFVISDIDKPKDVSPTRSDEDTSSTATITFTPINDDSTTAKIIVTQQTRPLDLTGELTRIEDSASEAEHQVELEKNEFEDFVPSVECQTQADIKKFIRQFSIKKRNGFLTTCFSIVLTLVLAFMKLPFMTSVILSHTRPSMIICTCVTGIIILLNIGMFKGLAKLFTRNAGADITASLASIAVTGYAVYGITQNEIILEMLLLLSLVLSFRSLGLFFRYSYMLSNLKQTASSSSKYAVSLISDTAVTFAMAKNAIEGDALIAAPKRCEHIEDYMKYSTFGTFIKGKINFISVLSVLLSLIIGFACSAYYEGAIDGLYTAAAIQCFAALPVLFMIDNLPLYGAAKRLNRRRAMIAGKTGAEHIEMANAIVLSSQDLFPEGTVTLHQMKVLSENNLDDTIIRAASLTQCLNSPLSPIFKKIAGTGNITTLPDSDTVKYEDRMGISGWVDNRLLFIGNRTLMEAHGISVPSVEFDRKILRSGYFPVYVATQDKACALLMVQYNVDPDISHELRRLTSLGVTLLINNTDPNLTEEMICDYMGLYNDSVKVMSAAGCHMYRNAVLPEKNASAPACYNGKAITLAAILNCATRIRRSNLALTVFYVLASIFGAILFSYSSFAISGALISSSTVLIYSLATTVIAYIMYLIQKP